MAEASNSKEHASANRRTNWRPSKIVWTSFLLIAVIGLGIWLKSTLFSHSSGSGTPESEDKLAKNKDQTAAAKTGTTALHPQSSISQKSTDAELKQMLKQESQKVGAPDDNPELTQSRLGELANSLSDHHLEVLKETALSQDLNGDERALSVYLLTLNQSSKSLDLLKEVSLAPLPNSTGPLQEQEILIRTLTIDGFVHHPEVKRAREFLKLIGEKSEVAAVSDRAQRAYASLSSNGQIPQPETQEKQALEKLLQPKGHENE